MSEELRPCPICNCPAQFSEDLCSIQCTFCGCEFGEYAHEETKTLAEYWNARPIEDDLRAELEQVKRERDVLAEWGSAPGCTKDDLLRHAAQKAAKREGVGV